MPFKEMKIKGAWVHTPSRHSDNRGHFEEQFKLSSIAEQLGTKFEVRQANQSVSKKGVIRGIHWTEGPAGQAKYISCPNGALWDVVVDLRRSSETYGQWDATIISAENGKSVFISEGLGHAFLALNEDTVANYLCSTEFNPEEDRTMNPLDKKLGIDFTSIAAKYGIGNFILSLKDSAAVGF